MASGARTRAQRGQDSCLPVKSLLIVCLALLLGLTCSQSTRPVEFEKIVQLARFGDFDQATALLDKLEAAPTAKLSDQAGYIALARHHVEQFRKADAELDELLRQHLAGGVSSFKALHGLKKLRGKLANRYLNDAFDARLSGYQDWVARVQGDADAENPTDPPMTVGVYLAKSEAELSGASLELVFDEIKEQAKAGKFLQAIQRINEQLPTAGPDEDRLRDLLWEVEDKADKSMKKLLKDAEVFEKQGKLEDAIVFLAKHAKNFPSTGALSHLQRQMRDYESMLRRSRNAVAKKVDVRNPDLVEGDEARDPTGRVPGHDIAKRAKSAKSAKTSPTPDDVIGPAELEGGRKILEDLGRMTQSELRRARRGLAVLAREELDKHAFGKAVEQYKLIGEICRIQAPQLAETYKALELEAELMAKSLQALPAAIKARQDAFKRIDIGYGEMASVIGADENGLKVKVRKDKEEVPYMSIPDKSLATLLRIAATTSEENIGAALIAFRGLQAKIAESLLLNALKLDKNKKPYVDRILARYRREDPGPGGYVLVKGKFVSSRAVMLKEALARFEKSFRKLMSINNAEVRDRAYAKILAEDETQRYFLVDALKARKQKLFASLGKVSFKSKLSDLRKANAELEKRRNHAKSLIFDTVKYFYPYRPPAVSGEKAKEYAKVQAEVDKRVASLREIWDGKSISLTLPKKVAKQLDFYRWLTDKLAVLSSGTPELDAKMGALLAARGQMTIRNFANDTKQRSFIERGDKIMADNDKLLARLLAEGKVNREQVALVGITNRYRRMFGHMPLSVDERLMRAAQGHANEMTRLGYFSHTSPTPGRRTPGERMRLEGYTRGGGENIARNFNAMAAHIAWIHSSGHHRNLLSPRHRDIGVGADGRNYVQNFGAGD